MENKELIKKNISNSIATKQELYQNDTIINGVVDISNLIIRAFQNGNKLLFCGNGGSAADAQHLAAEFSGRYYLDRAPLRSKSP